jgi:hypothetical protein
MERWIDTAAVLLFAGATAFVAVHARGWLATDAPRSSYLASEEPYATRVAAALPHLERHVAWGSMRTRTAPCDETARFAEIAELETAIGAGDDPALATPLAEGIASLRACLACTPEPHGCADAARAFTTVEIRLEPATGPSGI